MNYHFGRKYVTTNPTHKNYAITLIDMRVNVPLTYRVTAQAAQDAINAAIHRAMTDAGLSGRNRYFEIAEVLTVEPMEM